MGMAPTTSTTLTLGLGDALAVALMARREFNPEQFKIFHPGGKLGAQMATVKQLMHGRENVPLVEEDTPMETVLLEMTSKGFGHRRCGGYQWRFARSDFRRRSATEHVAADDCECRGCC